MGQQLKKGTQFPLRPMTATFDMAAQFVPPTDAAPVDWTASGTRLTPRIKTKVMDDNTQVSMSGTQVRLPQGIYKVRVNTHITNTSGGAQDVRVAVTNLAGTTVHYESGDITIPAGDDASHSADVVVTISATASGVNIRAAATGSITSGIQPEHILTVERIGNLNES